MQELQANTQVVVTIGPFVDVGDGFTPETGVTLGAADEAELVKHAGTTGNDISGRTFAVLSTAVDGYYNLTLTTGDTDTEGMLLIVIQDDDVFLPVKAEYMVLSQAAYVSKYTAKDAGFMDVNIRTIGRADAQETEADNLEAAAANYSATRGLTGTAVPAVAAGGAGGIPTDSTGITLFNNVAATDIVTSGAITTSGGVVSTVGTVSGSVDSVTGDTKQTADVATLISTVGAAGAGLSDLGGMSTGMKAEVNAECDGALDTAIPELTQGVPVATPTVRTGLMLVYMLTRNQVDVATSGDPDVLEVHNDAGTVIAKKNLTDDASDYSEAEMISGA